ncbi:Isoquinoline 1-oxidoreductase subunit [uncultured Jannaschia sp.]|uniref:Isoquinoline 1-oxidoreductase subunit n=1 Tax=uncultured Jannaschia sp. TaxID=293347 RepID=UPI0026157E1C|nr:Isoquinoline 1-oxidoreductase subunit [uncultured Jannaschia sp.]
MKITTWLTALLLAGAPALAQDLATELAGPDSFAGIEGDEARAAALFGEMAKVITHPRCMNCHPVGASPLQGDLMEPHQPPVVRGVADIGAVGMECTTCHGSENLTYVSGEGSIPGHEPWHIAPASMGWTGLSVAEICVQLKDPARNGDRTLAEIHEHNAEDGLVGWAWEPGDGRTPAPGTQELFGQLTQAWIDAGAHCPT